MRSTLRRRTASWAGASAHPWLTGGAWALLALVEQSVAPAPAQAAAATLLSTATLPWHRTRPGLAVLGLVAALLSFALDTSPSIAATVSGLVCCYTLGRRRVHHPATVFTGVALGSVAASLTHLAHQAAAQPPPSPSLHAGDWLSPGLYAEALALSIAVLGALGLGDAVRAREAARHERAVARSRLLTMERRQAAEAERAAVARELHDIVSHSVSMIAVQAESATYTIPDLSPQAREGFQHIAGTARSSMAELRRLLGVLRTDQDGRASTAPQPTLARLGELLEQHRAVGGRAELRINGDEAPLPTSWELSAYRIVQEALTNARRHAPGALAQVELHYRPDLLAIQISDDGPGPAADTAAGAGHGLVGMQERAALLGGRLTAGRGPAGGFLVEAELPW
jgi:signal transduction histidine kinase